MDAGGGGSEASEAATEFDDDSPVYVGYIRGDRSVVKAELRDETVRNGVVELHLFLVESGIKKRVIEERVIRQWPVEEDDDEVASVAASVAQSSAGPKSQVAPARAASCKGLDEVVSKAKTLQGLGVSDSDVLALCKVTAANVGCEWVSAAESVRCVLRMPVNAAAAMSRARSVSDANASVANACAQLDFDFYDDRSEKGGGSDVSTLTGARSGLFLSGLTGAAEASAGPRTPSPTRGQDEYAGVDLHGLPARREGGDLGASPHNFRGFEGDPLGLTREEAQEELKTATITFDTEPSRKPLALNLLPSATSIKDMRELDDSVVWVLRGAGSTRNQPQFLPGTYGAQLADQIFNRVHLAAAEHQTYPFPVEMTDFVVLSLCTGALDGAQDFLSGPNQTRFHNKMALVLNDLKLKEDIPDDWHRSATVRQNHTWPAGNVARSRVQIGGYVKQS